LYSKLFSSILDSSIWLEDDSTRIVWLTFLAAKDGEGFARFAAIENLARRANVSIEKATHAVEVLEAPDVNSSSQAHDGRRIERVPGGWMVLNAKIYDDMVRRDDERAATRERVRIHRDRKRQGVDPSAPEIAADCVEVVDDAFERAWTLYPSRGDHGNPKSTALKAWRARLRSGVKPEELLNGVMRYAAFVRAKGNEGTEFVKQASTFFGPSKFWLEPWNPPTPRNGSSREARNDAEIEAFARGE
jgi:hypothetical protein